MTSGILAEMTIDDVRALGPQVVVLPTSSTEPHGPHLPYGTDHFTCDGVCRRAVPLANQRGGRVLMYPALPIGNNVNFTAFPFACRIGVRTFMNVLLDLIDAVEQEGVRKIVIVNVHGGNDDTIRATLREHFDRPRPAGQERAFVCTLGAAALADPKALAQIQHPSPHAGEEETCRIMYLRPELVRGDKIGAFPMRRPVLEALENPRLHYVRPWHALMPASCGGDSRAATAEKGRAILESAADGLARFLVDLSQAPWHADFPFPPQQTGG